MSYSPYTVNGGTCFVSAGAEYINGAEIWVGQFGYIAITNTPLPNPTISISGDTTVSPSKSAVIDLIVEALEAYLYFNVSSYSFNYGGRFSQ